MKKEEKIETKMCRYCNTEFSRLDNPKSFKRMITCGSIECMGERRRELLRDR